MRWPLYMWFVLVKQFMFETVSYPSSLAGDLVLVIMIFEGIL